MKENEDPCLHVTYILNRGRRMMEADNKYCYVVFQKVVKCHRKGASGAE